MYADDQAGAMPTADSIGFGGVAEALRAGGAFADFLNSPAAAELSGLPCGEVLIALGGIQAKLAAAYADFLRRFDAADAHNADGYGSSSAWLAAKAQLTKRDARAAASAATPSSAACPCTPPRQPHAARPRPARSSALTSCATPPP
jgi:hypothetical protein